MASVPRAPSFRSLTLTAAVLVSSLLVTAASAQRVLVVDAANGPFTDLPAAEAVAQHGDVLDLRPFGGPYTAITTSKALKILGNGSQIRVSGPRPFRVSGLPAGHDFVLQNCFFSMNQTQPTPLLEFLQCKGRVHLEELEVMNLSGGAAVTLQDCRAVTLRRSLLVQGGLLARGSTVVLDACEVLGSTAFGQLPASEAIRAEASVLTLAGCTVVGGRGSTFAAAAPAMTLTAQSLAIVAGGKLNGSLTAGGAPGVPTPPAVQGQSSVLLIDPGVPVFTIGAPPFAGVTVTYARLPALCTTRPDNVGLAFEGDAATARATVIGAPADPSSSPAFQGAWWLAPAPPIVLPGVVPSLPMHLLPKGYTIAVQVGSLAGTSIVLSNPIVATAR